MSNYAEILLLAVASAFWPTLIVIVVLALRLEHPIKILAWFLVGGLLTTVTIGVVIVFALEGTSFVSGSSPPGDPALDFVAGGLSLLAAYAVRRSKRSAKPKPVDPNTPAKPSMAERAVGGGAFIAFASGVVLNIVPGTFPIVGLKDIAQLDVSDSAKVATVIVFYVIMFAFVEVPIVAYLFAPKRTTAAMTGFNSWLGRNAKSVAFWILLVVGCYLIARGIFELLT